MVRNSCVLVLGLCVSTAFAMDDAAILEQGRKLFQTDAEPACAICHTLADAGTQGKIGPVLDVLNQPRPHPETCLSACF